MTEVLNQEVLNQESLNQEVLNQEVLDQDVQALNRWLGQAWSYLADRNLTPFERREIRNYMKEAETALSAGLRRIADRERTRREAERSVSARRRVEFRILKLDA